MTKILPGAMCGLSDHVHSSLGFDSPFHVKGFRWYKDDIALLLERNVISVIYDDTRVTFLCNGEIIHRILGEQIIERWFVII